MTGSAAIWGGFSSFFSIWQVCILQISPFFLVFIVGLSLIDNKDDKSPSTLLMLLPCIGYTLGFSLVYALFSARGLVVGRLLISHVANLRMAAGVFVMLVALQFILVNRLQRLTDPHAITRLPFISAFLITGPARTSMIGLLLGVSFAAIYSPCVTPTYSSILQIAIAPETAMRGGVLAFYYGLGMSLALSLVGLATLSCILNMSFIHRHKPLVRNVSGLILGVLALMNMTGVMVYYKAFFLGLLV